MTAPERLIYVHHETRPDLFACASCKQELSWPVSVRTPVMAFKCACGCIHDAVPRVLQQIEHTCPDPPAFTGG